MTSNLATFNLNASFHEIRVASEAALHQSEGALVAVVAGIFVDVSEGVLSSALLPAI